ncbi:unnamed protein product [Mycena citricolor]|uniref:Endonuclease/exonuclease/phosphatase domain-containing protein n=1 Tax=Mycena citricolor TaxID=2018698 RepID=A0AAD2HM34_9AGAR|nr:unnamed protein product [Mycena citricolor]
MKTVLKVAGLNIRGHGNLNVHHPDNKWLGIWQILREQKIAVLVVGEAHMNQERKDNVSKIFGRKLRIEFTENPRSPNAAGLAFVINKNLARVDTIESLTVVPGRAMILKIQQADGSPLSILGVYAPNNPAKNRQFWEDIDKFFKDNPRTGRPDLMVGDTNVVEAAIDRLPAHEDDKNAVDALDELKSKFTLVDGWRATYPDTRNYTFRQPHALGGALSRIDRIYVKTASFENTFDWGIQRIGIETDHDLVWAKITTADAPTVGKGRWVWPAHIMKDRNLAEFILQSGLELSAALEELKNNNNRTVENNAQTLWTNFKTKIGVRARERTKETAPKIIKEIAELELKLANVSRDKVMSEEERHLNTAMIIDQIAKLQKQRYKSNRLTAQIQNRLHGEIIGRYWTKINKPSKPRDTIHRLKKPAPPGVTDAPVEYETNSKRMANMTQEYHDHLQGDRQDTSEQEREAKIERVLARTQIHITDEQNEKLKAKMMLEDVSQALKSSANFKAPGLDGIPYEL